MISSAKKVIVEYVNNYFNTLLHSLIVYMSQFEVFQGRRYEILKKRAERLVRANNRRIEKIANVG